ncbi:MAG: long-chain fatty acid--CoA ligase [Lewinellaceae bacterium]|nr:long-chain fatty acid--CoA ligase [Lewinellaceae bacterium]
MDFHRLFDILPYQMQRYPKDIAVSGRQNGRWHHWSTAQLQADSAHLAAALYQRGLRKNDCVGILAHCGSPEWIIVDLALQQIGVIPVPIHTTSRPDEIRHIAKDAALDAFFISNTDMQQMLLDAELRPARLFSFQALEGAVSLHQLLTEQNGTDLPEIGITPKDIATILYTSGTTGVPKGVVLTHENIVSNVKAVLAITPLDNSLTAVSFLPMSHIFERMVVYVYLTAGVSVFFVAALDQLPTTLKEVKPHFFTAVPRVLERSYERLLETRHQASWLKRKTLDWAIQLAEHYPYAGGGAIPLWYSIRRFAADVLVYRYWRKALGGRLQGIVVGAAALQPRLGRLFCAAGIEVREGYGLTETSPVISFNRFEPGGVHFGTVGIPVPGVVVRITAPNEQGEGEIEVKGPNVMQGYWNRPDETAAKFTPDGWLRTGDMGVFEFKRFLKITGRKSEIFKTSTGKFVAPGFVEQQLQHSPFVRQCMVCGLNQPHVGVLIVPNFDRLETWCREQNVHWTAPAFMILNPKVEKLFRQEIEQINQNLLSSVEKIQSFHLLSEEWTPENGLLTPTLKLRRERIATEHHKAVDALFKPGK